jgi:hypothetical protein
MARKLKTYQTSLGFFDLAMAAPSMKAALEAWGADSNLFHQGAAKEARRRSQAPGWNGPTFQRTRRAANRSWRRRTNEGRPQVEMPKGEAAFLSPCRQGCGTKGRVRLRTGTEEPRP